MIIKKFQGKTEEEATAYAKKELGDGVVIMNIRNVKRKGLFAFLMAPIVEVTVALEEETENMIPVKKKPEVPIVAPVNTGEMDTIGEKLDSLQSLLERKLNSVETETKTEKEDTAKAEEKPVEEKDEELVRFMTLLYKVMIENEVDEKYVNQIMDEVEKNHKANMPFDYALSNAYQKMILKFGNPAEIKPAENGVKVIFFVGPTGVGKTTTIAKIASKFRLEEKKKVALLTADTYRIAAAEQLRTYANILEVPFRVIYTAEEIKDAIAEFKDYDYIFVDTAGHSPQNVEQKEIMLSFIRGIDEEAEKEVFLVLSATTKERDLMNIADSYKDVADYNLIFTKLDETGAVGNLLNLKMYTGAEIAYITYGQNVPNDIEKFNPQKTVKQLLGGKI